MIERLTLAEAQERARLALLAVPDAQREAAADMARLSEWDTLPADFALNLALQPSESASMAVRVTFRAVARVFLGYCAFRDHEAGGKAERANAVALLRERAASAPGILFSARIELAEVALRIERGMHTEKP